MMAQIARLHIMALPHTWSSRRGERFVANLYKIVERLGYVVYAQRGGEIVGVVSGIGKWILTLVVDPDWQRRGVGRELLDQLGGERYVYTELSSVGFYQKLGFRQIMRLGKIIFLWRK